MGEPFLSIAPTLFRTEPLNRSVSTPRSAAYGSDRALTQLPQLDAKIGPF